MHLTSSAPTRIDLAGGTIDIWPLYLFHDGAVTLNAAISLRAHVAVERRNDGRIELRSIDTDCRVCADHWSALDGAGDLSLLALLARHYRVENATITTRGESPAGAGIAGSSALTIALCGALAQMDRRALPRARSAPRRKKCRVSDDPRADRRAGLPAGALWRHRGRRTARTASTARPLEVDPRELEQRIVLAYTGAPRNSGTNNWEITKRHIDGDRHIFDCFERIRDTAAAMRSALETRRWDDVGRQIATNGKIASASRRA